MKRLITIYTLLLSSAAVAQNNSWLPDVYKTPTNPSTAFVNNFLKQLNGSIRLMLCRYEGNKLVQKNIFLNNTLKTPGAQWQYSILQNNASKENDEIEFTVKFKIIKGSEESSGVAVAFDYSPWTLQNYVFAPGMLYDGNRFKVLPIQYPPYIHDAKERPLNMPVTTTNILHLNKDGSHAKVEMNTGNVATPMLGFFNQKDDRGFILLTGQKTEFGNNGLFVEEEAEKNSLHKQVSFVISAPGVREERYVMCGRAPSGDKAADWKAGDEIALTFRLYNFEANSMPAFYQKVFSIRKALTGRNSYTNVTPYSEAAALIVEHHNKDKWFQSDSTAYYCNRPGDTNPYSYQIGWSELPVIAFPEIILATPERLHRVVESFDNMIFKAQAKTGLFYAINRNGKIFGDPHGKMEERYNIAMTRRSMEVLCWGIKSLDLLKKTNHQDLINPSWEQALKKCADALINVWNRYGQFGQFINVENYDMDINGSTAGCYAGTGLALAAVYFHEPKYLKIAEAATKFYYQNDFLKGYAGGGAAEILQSPDSEAPWDMVESCMTLHDITGNPEWIEYAKFATNMLATWMVSYDYKFPKGSAMEKAGTHAAGSIFASSQNNHAAPGYYILSGDMLLKLFRATGDRRYAEMYKDQSHNVIQYVGAPYNPLRTQGGFVTERVQLSDWEGNDQGSVSYHDSNMAWEILAALTASMNPGIYLHTDDNTFLVMDHIDAKIMSRNKTDIKISITNPTKYNASVSILAETKAQAKEALPLNGFIKWQKVKVKAGETRIEKIDMNGKLIVN